MNQISILQDYMLFEWNTFAIGGVHLMVNLEGAYFGDKNTDDFIILRFMP